MTGSSIFGGPSLPSWQAAVLRPTDAQVPAEPQRSVDKGKGKATSVEPVPPAQHIEELFHKNGPPSISPQQGLWSWDTANKRFKLNWRCLYTARRRLESNWELGKYTNFQLPHPDHPEEGHGECIYSLQFNDRYLVSGSRDRSLKIWDLETRRCLRTLAKHRGSVLCLQFDSDEDDDIVVSGSSDSDVIIWQFSTGREIQTLREAHNESVLNVKFDKRILVTCSKDKTIKIFNRRPLRHGDLGYQEVVPVPTSVQNYGYALNFSPEDLPQTPGWTMLGVLEGHSAAVNAVQIHGREVVSASGDRHIKVWDWPTQTCTRTIVGHTKGIACVQYDGRRIVSGSSDNEVKVFDRQTGLEVASLRAHSNLVRTVQAGFGDLPYSVEDDAAEAKKVDAEYFKALESGRLGDPDRPRLHGRRPGNAGSRRPEDICAYGAKLPPGGGGGKYGRIISGSYDTSIIIWRRDKEGIWKDQHHLKQEEAAMAAYHRDRTPRQVPPAGGMPPQPSIRDWTHPSPALGGAGPGETSALVQGSARNGVALPNPALPLVPGVDNLGYGGLTAQAVQQFHQIIDRSMQLGHQALSQAISAQPAILSQRQYMEAAIDRQPNAVVRSQLRQVLQGALIRAQFDQARQRREAARNQEAALSSGTGAATPQGQAGSSTMAASRSTTAVRPAPPATTAQMAAATAAAAAAHQAHAQPNAPSHGTHLHQLQYDVRRIICCSQTSVIVGWDFCNDDDELQKASRFFGHVQ